MRSFAIVFTLIFSASYLIAEEFDKDAILKVLRDYRCETVSEKGEDIIIKPLDYLLDLEFRTEFRTIRPKEIRKLKFDREAERGHSKVHESPAEAEGSNAKL